MKRLLLLGLLLLADTGIVLAQGIPQSMSYQGYVTDLTGTPVADGNYNFTFTLWTSDVAGASVWTENHTNVLVSKGLFTVQLGRGNPSMPLTIAFDQQLYLGIRIGADPELTPRVRLATSAYSFRAKMADNVPPWLIIDAHVGPTANIAASKLQSTVLTETEVVAGTGITINNTSGTLTISAPGGAVTLAGDVNGDAGSNTIADNAVTAAKIAPNIVSSISGVSNDGGDIALVAGANVTITPNDAANTVTIAASGGGGGGLTLPYAGTANSSATAFIVEQSGTGKAGHFHIGNTASTEHALEANTLSTSPSSVAVHATAAGGTAFAGSSSGATTITSINTGSSGAFYGTSSDWLFATITAYNLSTNANAAVLHLGNNQGITFIVDKEGDVAAEGHMSADYYKATTSLDAGTPVAGATYKDNIVYVWGRIAADGSFSGQSYGVSSVTRNSDTTYTVTFKTTFASGSDYAVTVSPMNNGNFEIASPLPITANSVKVKLHQLTISSNNVLMTDIYDDFFIIVTGRP